MYQLYAYGKKYSLGSSLEPRLFLRKFLIMDIDDLDTSVHDGWVDFDYNENTGELSGLFEDSDPDEYINNLNDWD